ncbi:hypothetical protein BG842_20585 [Haladaptatus sp. W1]|uniref:S8 family serine peptidase n=1 Tax=Haladaptatus sp. W1 TaxID=1897478 RepID=UPI0008499708|nr:S8 family serine peptidase [Haladaptatus sp. W1]ODR81689.1 hypothetical protein BG842_20585 [Haladaptatus sp. W1]
MDFQKFDPALFNVELLVEQNLTDAETGSIPVIASVSQDGKRYTAGSSSTVETPASTLDSVSDADVTHSLHSIDGASASVSKDDAARTYEQLARSDEIESVVLDAKYDVALDETGDLVNATGARQRYGVSGDGITVGVLDTGINQSHPDLQGSVVLERDFTGQGITYDTMGHGTHVAGIIAGDGTASGGQYVGMAPNASLIDARVCQDRGCYTSDVIDGLEYAVDNGADVVSISIGGTAVNSRANDRYADAMAYADSRDVPVVVAAGNSGPEYSTVESPGIHRNVITVGASDKTGGIASFSSRGPTPVGRYLKPDVVAPGVLVTSANASSDGYVSMSGTSMATPVVSGTVALMLDEHPSWSADRIKNTLVSTADPLGTQDVYTQGAGRINASEAVKGDVSIDPGVIDFGRLSATENVSRVVTVTNHGTANRTFNVSATAEEINSGTAGNVSVNRTTITLTPGDSTDLNLTVVPTAGTYSGRISLNGEYSAIFGYEQSFDLTVEKTGIGGTSVRDDAVWLVSNESGSAQYTGFDGYQFLNGSGTVTYHLSTGGSYHLITDGIDERTGEFVTISKAIDVSGDRTVTLDESNTVRYSFDTTAAETQYGPLDPRDTMVSYARHLPSGSYGASLQYAPNSTARFNTDTRLNVSVGSAFVPSGTPTDEPFNSSVLFHVVHQTGGVTGFSVYDVDPAKLGRRNVSYYWPDSDPEHSVASFVMNELGGLPDESWVSAVSPTPDDQTLYVTPGLDYGLSATDTVRDGWYLDQWKLTTLTAGESIDDDVGRGPYLGSFYRWQFESGVANDSLTFTPAIQVDQSGVERKYNDSVSDTIQTCVNGTCDEWYTDDWLNRSYSVNVSSGDDVTITTDGVNAATPLSTRTKTTYRTTYSPGTDNTPPRFSRVNVTGLTRTGIAHNGTITVRFTVNDASTVENEGVLFATGTVYSTSFNGSSAWSSANVTDLGGGVYEATYDVGGYTGPVSIALEADDANGNRIETTSFGGFAVADIRKPTVNVTAVGTDADSTAPPADRTMYTNGTLVANATATGTPGDARAVRYVLSADFASYRTTLPAVRTDGANWTATMDLRSLPDDGNYSLGAWAVDDGSNTERVATNATVVLDRSSPGLGATLERLNQTRGRVTVRSDEALSSAPDVTVNGPSTVETPTATKNGSVWEASFSVPTDGEYDVTVNGSDSVGNVGTANASANFSTVSTVNKTVTVKLNKSNIFVRFETNESVNGSFVTLTESRSELAPLSPNLAGLSFLHGQIGNRLSKNLTNATIGIPVERLRLPKGNVDGRREHQLLQRIHRNVAGARHRRPERHASGQNVRRVSADECHPLLDVRGGREGHRRADRHVERSGRDALVRRAEHDRSIRLLGRHQRRRPEQRPVDLRWSVRDVRRRDERHERVHDLRCDRPLRGDVHRDLAGRRHRG